MRKKEFNFHEPKFKDSFGQVKPDAKTGFQSFFAYRAICVFLTLALAAGSAWGQEKNFCGGSPRIINRCQLISNPELDPQPSGNPCGENVATGIQCWYGRFADHWSAVSPCTGAMATSYSVPINPNNIIFGSTNNQRWRAFFPNTVDSRGGSQNNKHFVGLQYDPPSQFSNGVGVSDDLANDIVLPSNFEGMQYVLSGVNLVAPGYPAGTANVSLNVFVHTDYYGTAPGGGPNRKSLVATIPVSGSSWTNFSSPSFILSSHRSIGYNTPTRMVTLSIEVTTDNVNEGAYVLLDDITLRPATIPAMSSARVCAGSNSTIDLLSLLNTNYYGGTFSGTGVNGTSFNSTGLAEGNYTISYNYVNCSGAQATAQTTITVYPRLTMTPELISAACTSNNTFVFRLNITNYGPAESVFADLNLPAGNAWTNLTASTNIVIPSQPNGSFYVDGLAVAGSNNGQPAVTSFTVSARLPAGQVPTPNSLFCANILDASCAVEQACIDASILPAGLAIVATFNRPTCIGSSNGQIIPNASGGIQPYFYAASNVNGGARVNDFNAVNAGTYLVQVTDAQGCQARTNVVVGSSINNCNGRQYFCQGVGFVPDLVFNSSTNNSAIVSSLSGSSQITGKTIMINDDFFQNLPAGFSFVNCNIRMWGYTSMSVNTGSLNIESSTISGCNDMWYGIHTNTTGPQTLNVNNSRIEDAYSAIDMTTDDIVNVNNTVFHANEIGLQLSKYANTPGNNNPILTRNTFECTNDVLLGYVNTPTRSACGIALVDVPSFSIPSRSLSLQNIYQDMSSGIIARNSNVSVFGERFIRLNGTAINQWMTPTEMGCGISSSGSTQNRLLNVRNGVYIDCGKGIYTEGMVSPVINGTIMRNVDMGIHAKAVNGAQMNINVSSNDITANLLGVDVTGNVQYVRNARSNISGNVVRMPFGNNAGIRVALLFDADINSNTVVSNDAQYGLHVRSVDIFRSKGNRVNLSSTNNGSLNMKAGIRYESSHFGDCGQNTVETIGSVIGYYFNDDLGEEALGDVAPGLSGAEFPVGIESVNTHNSVFNCDVTRGTRTGIRMQDDCTSSFFSSSSLNNHKWGVHYSSNVIAGTPPQGQNSLSWSNNFADGVDKSGGFYRTAILYNPNGPIQGIPQNIYSGFNSNTPLAHNAQIQGWFLRVPLPFLYCVRKKSEPVVKKEVAKGEFMPEEFAETTIWEQERILYEQLAESDSLRLSDTIFTKFWDKMDTLPVSDYYEVSDEVKQVSKNISSQDEALSLMYTEYQATFEALSIADSMMMLDSIAPLDVERWKTEAIRLRERLDSLGQANEQLLAAIKQDQQLKSDLARTSNTALAASKIFEENEKNFNEVYLKTVAVGKFEFSEQDSATLAEIAFQCPLLGGEIVYTARAVYGIANPLAMYQDHVTCAEVGIHIKRSRLGKGDGLEFNVSPNPAAQWATVSWRPTKGNGSIALYDLLGKQIGALRIVTLESGATTLDLSELLPGVYVCELRIDGMQPQTQKIVVVRD